MARVIDNAFFRNRSQKAFAWVRSNVDQVGAAIRALSSITALGGSYIKRNDANSIEIGSVVNDTHAAAFRLRLDGDGMLLVRGGFTNTKIAETGNVPATNLTGTFTTADVNTNAYTTQVGAYFDLNFEGVGLTFQHYADDRGGLWHFSIDGGAPIPISVWGSVSGDKTSIVATGLNDGLHTCRVTFQGADPAHAPSTAPARGWFKYVNSGTYATGIATKAVEYMNPTGAQDPLALSSVTEFALSVKPDGTALAGSWIPMHSDLGVSRGISRSIVVNGADIGANIGTISTKAEPLSSFSVLQTYTAYCAADSVGDYPLWDGVIKHTYSNGLLTVEHDISVLRDTYCGAGYLMMLPSAAAHCDTLVFEDGTRLATAVEDSTTAAPTASRSATFLNASAKIAAAVSGDSLAVLLGPNYAERTDPIFMVNRSSDGVSKAYWKRFDAETIPQGAHFRNINRYFLTANAPGVADL